METKFAPAERASDESLAEDIALAGTNPVMTGLLHSINGLLAILNEQRQIIALNDSFLEKLGVDDPAEALGLRPGEAMQCVHAHDMPGGCGTSGYCSTCGSAIAIVSCLGEDKPVERLCALRAKRDGLEIDLALSVQACPIHANDQRFVLIFLKDVSILEHRAALERTFYHDVNNLISVLVGASDMLQETDPSEMVELIQKASARLRCEIDVQRCLSQGSSDRYAVTVEDTTVSALLKELSMGYANHPAARGKHLDVSDAHAGVTVRNDTSILLRVLSNMITNAFEATEANGTVRLWTEIEDGHIVFNVWNSSVIPDDVARRVFQRNFSTKGGAGRGLGTYSMKLFGEKILKGSVTFSSSQHDGTVFRLRLEHV